MHCPVGISDRATTAHHVVHMRTTDSKTPVGWAGVGALGARGRARVQGLGWASAVQGLGWGCVVLGARPPSEVQTWYRLPHEVSGD